MKLELAQGFPTGGPPPRLATNRVGCECKDVMTQVGMLTCCKRATDPALVSSMSWPPIKETPHFGQGNRGSRGNPATTRVHRSLLGASASCLGLKRLVGVGGAGLLQCQGDPTWFPHVLRGLI